MNRYVFPLAVIAASHLPAAVADEQPLELEPISVTAEPFADRGELESTRPVDVLVGDALDRARAAIGWAPKIDLRDGIAETVAYFRGHALEHAR